jgi:predicted dehydrogenase
MTGIGLVGAGYFGAIHAEAISSLGDVELVAVASGRFDQARRLAATFGGRACEDWREVIEDAAVGVVCIATPHHLHADIAIAALQAGRHVLLEKPMAPTVAACEAILAAERAGGARLMVGHLPRFLKPIMSAAAIVSSGQLGRPIAGTSTMRKLWMQTNRRPWHLDPATGGGMLMTAGIHALDQLVWLMGSRVAGVSAIGGALFHDQPADDTMLLNLRFSDGRLGQVASIGYQNGAGRSALSLQCEHGTLDVDLARGVRIGRRDAWEAVEDASIPDGMVPAVAREWRAFLEAIGSGSPLPVRGDYARHLVAVIDAARLSSQERREVAIS